uniref:Uncharacterized protein n=1 Tax=Anopheles atroparvus TaxID=41427 RepID=A0A182JIA8_ANOAO
MSVLKPTFTRCSSGALAVCPSPLLLLLSAADDEDADGAIHSCSELSSTSAGPPFAPPELPFFAPLGSPGHICLITKWFRCASWSSATARRCRFVFSTNDHSRLLTFDEMVVTRSCEQLSSTPSTFSRITLSGLGACTQRSSSCSVLSPGIDLLLPPPLLLLLLLAEIDLSSPPPAAVTFASLPPLFSTAFFVSICSYSSFSDESEETVDEVGLEVTSSLAPATSTEPLALPPPVLLMAALITSASANFCCLNKECMSRLRTFDSVLAVPPPTDGAEAFPFTVAAVVADTAFDDEQDELVDDEEEDGVGLGDSVEEDPLLLPLVPLLPSPRLSNLSNRWQSCVTWSYCCSSRQHSVRPYRQAITCSFECRRPEPDSGSFAEASTIVSLLPQSIPEVFIGLRFGHCFYSILTAARTAAAGTPELKRLAPIRACEKGETVGLPSLPQQLRRRRRRRRVEPADGNGLTVATGRHWAFIRSAPHRTVPCSDPDHPSTHELDVRQKQLRRVDVLLLTFAHLDPLESAFFLLSFFPVRTLLTTSPRQ